MPWFTVVGTRPLAELGRGIIRGLRGDFAVPIGLGTSSDRDSDWWERMNL